MILHLSCDDRILSPWGLFYLSYITPFLDWPSKFFQSPIEAVGITVSIFFLIATLILLAPFPWARSPLPVLTQKDVRRISSVILYSFTIFTLLSIVTWPVPLRPLALANGFAFSAMALHVRQQRYRTVMGLFFAFWYLALGWLSKYESQFGPPLYDTYLAVFQADSSESWDYVIQFIDLPLCTLSFCALLCLILMGRWNNQIFSGTLNAISLRAKNRFRQILVLQFFACAVLFGALYDTELRIRMLFFIRSLEHFNEEVRQQQVLLERVATKEISLPKQKNKAPLTIVFLLGESTTRRHLQLYGYHRHTTPTLDHLHKQNKLLVQWDTISPHSHTVPSVTEMLTPANFDDGTFAKDCIDKNLITVLNRMGIETFWFSNQNEFGLWENPVTLIAKQAEHWHFHRKSFGKLTRGGFYDGALLHDLEQALKHPALQKFIVLHLYATHGRYCGAVPPEKQSLLSTSGLAVPYFGSAPDRSEDVNCYDNAVKYVDELFGEIQEQIDNLTMPVILVYIPDHGEDPEKGTGHNATLHSASHIEVPHIWYFNDHARVRFTDKVAEFIKHSEKPFKSSDFYHLILDILEVEPGLFNPARSLFSPNYQSRKRLTVPMIPGVDDLATEFWNTNTHFNSIAYDDHQIKDRKDYFELARAHLYALKELRPNIWSKIYVHRVNTIGKLLEAKNIFAGAELDLIYHPEKNKFKVYHPPAKDVGLSLEKYLEAAKDKSSFKFWFDWKNPDPQHIPAAIQVFEALDRRYHLKERTLIEVATFGVFPELRTLSLHGFRVAYYSPTEQIMQCCATKNIDTSIDCHQLARQIHSAANTIGAAMVSYDWHANEFMLGFSSIFPNTSLVTWNTDLNISVFGSLNTLSVPDNVEIYLVTFPSTFDR